MRVSRLTTRLPRTKGLALVVGGHRRGTVITVKKLVLEANKAVGAMVVERSGGSTPWREPLENITLADEEVDS